MRPAIISLSAQVVFLSSLPICVVGDSPKSETDVLFQCSLNNSANSVSVRLFQDRVQYVYSDGVGRVELSIDGDMSDVGYTPFMWDSLDITERITFQNGETSYEVFNTMIRSGASFTGGSIGGVVVNTPSAERIEIPCDANSITPDNVFDGIGRLAGIRDEGYDAFLQCLSSDLSATACLNVQVASCGVDTDDKIVCLTAEYDRWRAVLDEKLGKATELDHAQSLWEASRDADCEISAWVIYNPFERDEGMLSCLSEYTAMRVDFVSNYIYGLEFDG